MMSDLRDEVAYQRQRIQLSQLYGVVVLRVVCPNRGI